MKEWFKHLKITSFILNIVYFIFGAVLLFNSSLSKRSVILIIGIFVILYGIVHIINFFIYGYESFGLTAGLIYIVLGLFTVCCSRILTTERVFSFMCGFILLVSSLFRIPNLAEYRKNRIKYWWLDIIATITILVVSILIIHNPFNTLQSLLTTIGVGIIIDCIFQISLLTITSGKIKGTKHSIRELFLLDDEEN